MSGSAQLALRKALFMTLSADTGLTALMGAGRIFDSPGRGQAFPYLVLETLGAEPLLSHPDEGLAHDIRLVALSRSPSRDEALTILERVTDALMTTPPEPSGHKLVGLQVAGLSSRLLRDGRTFRADASLRAVTEPET